ncbi:MAG: helix-turn-helix transcriptional regulator [Hyphomicrobiales bacterium]|nr:helix-turn-helix transcriptional regulator [Hyphomicrobiales bacterium]
MTNMAPKTSSLRVRRALETLGSNIKTARIKRRISIKDFAERIGVSKRTVIRLEKGDDGVSIGTLAMACMVLGEVERIEDLLDAGTDETGLLMDREHLPKRIDSPRKRTSKTKPDTESADHPDDDEGVGF